jgi:hypothetical protein
MRECIALLCLGMYAAPGFAQGRLQFATDSLHLVYYDASTGPLAGSAVSSANMPGGITLVADLYAGTADDSLTLVSTTSFGAVAGRWASIGGSLSLARRFRAAQPHGSRWNI